MWITFTKIDNAIQLLKSLILRTIHSTVDLRYWTCSISDQAIGSLIIIAICK